MHPRTLKAFTEELKAIEKEAVDPVAAAGMMAMGKIMATNALNRFGHKIPLFRGIAREVAGVGARTAMQGKPMLHPAIRHALAIGVDPKMVSAYEMAHQTASQAGTNLPHYRQMALNSGLAQQFPAAKSALDFAKDVPLESKGLRKVVDYGFTPVGQVAKDVGGAVRSGASKLTQGVQKGVTSLKNRLKLRKTGINPL